MRRGTEPRTAPTPSATRAVARGCPKAVQGLDESQAATPPTDAPAPAGQGQDDGWDFTTAINALTEERPGKPVATSNRFAALAPETEPSGPEGVPLLGPLVLESDSAGDLMPLLRGKPLKKEYANYSNIEVAIDSGAAASVMPERMLPGHPIRPSEGSKAGVRYLAADGGSHPQPGGGRARLPH